VALPNSLLHSTAGYCGASFWSGPQTSDNENRATEANVGSNNATGHQYNQNRSCVEPMRSLSHPFKSV